MGKDEPNGEGRRKAQLGHDGLEVVSIGPQAMQPDDGGTRRGAGLDLDGLEQLAHADVQPRVSAATRTIKSS